MYHCQKGSKLFRDKSTVNNYSHETAELPMWTYLYKQNYCLLNQNPADILKKSSYGEKINAKQHSGQAISKPRLKWWQIETS